jgi:hypothetical protein
MLTLKYVGPRVEINQHGVFYKDGKADKFIYIAMAAIILKNLDTDHSKKVYEIDNKISIFDVKYIYEVYLNLVLFLII